MNCGGETSSMTNLSLNSMQLAIISLKEKYQQKQKQVEILESERSQLILSKENLYNELKKLHQANEKLREQNLKLSTDLEVKSKECLFLCKTLQDNGIQDEIGLSENSLTRRETKRSSLEASHPGYYHVSDGSNLLVASLDGSGSSERLKDLVTTSGDVISSSSVSSDRILVDQVANNFLTIRDKIKQDQTKLLSLLKIFKENKNKTEKSANKLIDVVSSCSLTSAQKMSGSSSNMRKCPMCEAEFALDVPQDEFELHVVEHFNYEESETLKNFDTLPDAFLSDKRTSELEEEEERCSESETQNSLAGERASKST